MRRAVDVDRPNGIARPAAPAAARPRSRSTSSTSADGSSSTSRTRPDRAARRRRPRSPTRSSTRNSPSRAVAELRARHRDRLAAQRFRRGRGRPTPSSFTSGRCGGPLRQATFMSRSADQHRRPGSSSSRRSVGSATVNAPSLPCGRPTRPIRSRRQSTISTRTRFPSLVPPAFMIARSALRCGRGGRSPCRGRPRRRSARARSSRRPPRTRRTSHLVGLVDQRLREELEQLLQAVIPLAFISFLTVPEGWAPFSIQACELLLVELDRGRVRLRVVVAEHLDEAPVARVSAGRSRRRARSGCSVRPRA